MLVMYVVVSGCVCTCGSTWDAVLAGRSVTACEVLVESPGWLVVSCSWVLFITARLAQATTLTPVSLLAS